MELQPETEADAAKGASAAEHRFEALFRDYHRVILTAAYNRLNNRRDAEDAAAEVFSAAWRLRADAGLVFTLPWLYGTLRNVVGHEYRRRVRATARLEKAAHNAEHGTPDAAADDDARDVHRAIMSLGGPDRELIWMAYWEELTGEEMAAILGCGHAALRVRLHRARRRLKAELETDNPTPSIGGSP